MSDQAKAPGWYPAPNMVNTLCYWDGARWTDKVMPATQDTKPKPTVQQQVINGLAYAAIAVFVVVVAILLISKN
jgi:hypothetical protein